jgi:hypothetical protein
VLRLDRPLKRVPSLVTTNWALTLFEPFFARLPSTVKVEPILMVSFVSEGFQP